MRNAHLQELLKQWGPDEEVILVVNGEDVEDGTVLEIESEDDVLFRLGKVNIIGTADYEEDDVG